MEENCYLARHVKQIFPEAYNGTLMENLLSSNNAKWQLCFTQMEEEMDIIEDLNDKQKEAVLAVDGPCLVIAGAGSRKNKSINTQNSILNRRKTCKALEYPCNNFYKQSSK